MGTGQDRESLRKLQQRNREQKLDAQQRRIKAREVDEMDRLKKLILSGRSPLDDCPPEMMEHPVFVFWRLVNKEVDKMNKARVDAYYRKYRRAKRGTCQSSAREVQPSEEASLVSLEEAEIREEPPPPIEETPTTFAPPVPINLKYEDEGVKKLRNLTTVEELYQMADKIIGVPKTDVPR